MKKQSTLRSEISEEGPLGAQSLEDSDQEAGQYGRRRKEGIYFLLLL